VIEACATENRLDTLQALGMDLDRCQKSLSDYLDTKRNAFPRFFFISDDELLSILGSSDPTCVQEHMLKMFDNTQDLIFGTGRLAKVCVCDVRCVMVLVWCGCKFKWIVAVLLFDLTLLCRCCASVIDCARNAQ